MANSGIWERWGVACAVAGLALGAGAVALPEAVDGVVTVDVPSGTVVYDTAVPETATKLVKTGAGEAQLTVASTATCPVEVQAGTLTPTLVNALGSAASSAGAVTVLDGASLKFGFAGTGQGNIMMSRTVHISGKGVDEKGAFQFGASTDSATSDSLLLKLVLDADATIGVPKRWGVREIVFDGHTLTRVGSSNFMLYYTKVGAGHFVNTEGTVTPQGATFAGTAEDSSLTVRGGTIDFWNSAGALPWTVHANNDSTVFSTGSGTPGKTSLNNRLTGVLAINENLRSTAKHLNIDARLISTNNASKVKTFYVGNNGELLSVVSFRDNARSENLRLALNDLALVNVFGGAITASMTRVANGGAVRSAMRQTAGLWANGAWDQLHVGESAGSYGAYVLEDGRLEVLGDHNHNAAYVGKSASATRRSVGMLVQKGGVYWHTGTSTEVCNSLTVGYQGYGYCIVTGGTNDTFTKQGQVSRLRVAQGGGVGVVAVSGSNTVMRTGAVDGGSQSTNYTMYVSVRDGATFAADRLRIYTPTNSAECAAKTVSEFYFDGGVLKPTYSWGYSGIGATDENADSRTPRHFTIGPNGLVIDTSECYNSAERVDRDLSQMVLRFDAPTGKGLASITLPELPSSAVYMGPVPLFIEGAGHGAVAYADYDFDTKTFTPVILAPGCDYDETTKVYFPAANSLDGASGRLECTYTLADNATTGGLTKRGDMRLELYRPNTYGGPTVVEEGLMTLEAQNLLPTTTRLTVNKGATLQLVGETVAGLAGQGTVKGGPLTCTGDLTLNAADTFAEGATPLTFENGRKLTFGEGSRVVIADPENLDAHKDAGSRVVVRVPGGIEGKPTFVLPEGVSCAWHVRQSGTEIKLSHILGTQILVR